MKKLLFVCVAVAASLLFTNTSKAQTQKIGYFDEESVLGTFPGISRVDTLMSIYNQDSIGAEYTYRLSEYQRADSAFKKDSATLSAKAREIALRELGQKRNVLIQWQQISQQMSNAKLDQLLSPYRQRILEAMKQVVAEGKYTLVLNASVLSLYAQPPIQDNLSIRVAMKLKLPIPKDVEDAFRAATGGAAAPAGGAKKG